jgi:hypothetical protein
MAKRSIRRKMKRRNRATRRRKMRGGMNTGAEKAELKKENTAAVQKRDAPENKGSKPPDLTAMSAADLQPSQYLSKQDFVQKIMAEKSKLSQDIYDYKNKKDEYKGSDNSETLKQMKRIMDDIVMWYEGAIKKMEKYVRDTRNISIDEEDEIREKQDKYEREDFSGPGADMIRSLRDLEKKYMSETQPPPSPSNNIVEENNPESVASGNMPSEEIAGKTVNNDNPPEIKATNSIEDAKQVFLPYLNEEIKRLNQGKEVLSKDSNKSEDKNELMSHYKKEISIVEQKREIVDKWNKGASDLKQEIIDPEAKDRRRRKNEETRLLAKIDSSTTKQGENDNQVVTTESLQQTSEQGIATEPEPINTENTSKKLGDAREELQEEREALRQINESSESLHPERANASIGTDPLQNSGHGVTAEKVDRVCNELKARIEELEKEVKELESKKGGRKSRNNKKKKKSKAKKNKTRRRRRSKA